MLAGSVFMLAGIIVLYHAGGKTFDILELTKINYPVGLQLGLFLAFFAAFAVKMPMFQSIHGYQMRILKHLQLVALFLRGYYLKWVRMVFLGSPCQCSRLQ